MKKSLLVLTIFLLFWGGGIHAQQMNLSEALEGAARAVEEALPPETMLAVLNFASSSEAFSDYVIEELTGELVMGGKLTVVDRHNLRLIREEMNLQLSGDVSDESARAVGKMLGAQSIVSGTLANMGTFYRFRVRAIDVKTAAIQTQIALDLQNDSQVAFLLGNDTSGLPPPESGPPAQKASAREQAESGAPRKGDNLALAAGARAGYSTSRIINFGAQFEFILKRRFSIQLDFMLGPFTTYEYTAAYNIPSHQSYRSFADSGGYLISLLPKYNFYLNDRFAISPFAGVGLDIYSFSAGYDRDFVTRPLFGGIAGVEGAFILGETRRWVAFADLRGMYYFGDTIVELGHGHQSYRPKRFTFQSSPVFDITLGLKYLIPIK